MGIPFRTHRSFPMKYLGIDCGGSRITGVVLSSEGRIASTARAAGGNASLLSKARLKTLLRKFLRQLLPGSDFSDIGFCIAGFAGAGREGVKADIASMFYSLGISRLRILSDLELAHLTVFDQSQGILLVSGTGSACLFRNSRGQLKQAGGWGYALGDEGSGFAIGREAIRVALLESEFVGDTALSRFVERLTGKKSSRENLLHFVYSISNPQAQIAACARSVCEFAESGEAWALRIIDTTAAQLFDLLQRVVAANDFDIPVRLALYGGLLQNPTPVRKALVERVATLEVDFVSGFLPPAVGGALRALETQAGKVDTEVIQNLSQVVL